MRSRPRSPACRRTCTPPPTRCASRRPPPSATGSGISRRSSSSPMPDEARRVSPHGRLLTAALIVLAVGLRVAAFLDPPPLNTDEARYLIAAHHLRSGLGYADWRGPEVDIHPLHPFLVSRLGVDPASLEIRGRGVALLGSLLLLCPLYLAARRLGGPAAASFFLLLAGIHPWLVRGAAPAQPESLYVLLVAVAMGLLWP